MANDLTLFVGTYTRQGSAGIYTGLMNPATGAIDVRHITTGIENPSFVAVDPTGEHLYSVCETSDPTTHGAITAFEINGDGSLRELNRQSTGGPGPCHLAVDATDQLVIAANYKGGSVAMIRIEPDGSLGDRCDFIQHHGSSVHPDRQDQPHAHSITLNATNDRAYVCDLGTDRIVQYQIDADAGRLHHAGDVVSHPGEGPRHFAFHPTKPYAYVINELGSTVAAYDVNPNDGNLSERQILSTLPSEWNGANTTADIHVSPNGRFLYGSNRGHDSIAIFAIDPPSGRLDVIGHESSRGQTPRNFALSPDGNFLLAENQDSGTIHTFAIDPDTGLLDHTGHIVDIPAPVCVVFRPSADQ